MSTLTDDDFIAPVGAPALIVRFFGWASLTVLAAFLIGNVLITWFDHPTLISGLSTGDRWVWIQLTLYIIALGSDQAPLLRFDDLGIGPDFHAKRLQFLQQIEKAIGRSAKPVCLRWRPIVLPGGRGE